MIKKAFIDSDVILDVATGRAPFFDASKSCLSILERGLAIGVMSSNSVTNIFYVLRKLSSNDKARHFLATILRYISVVTVDHDTIVRALESKFLDFEDGVQNYCALKSRCDVLITRNTEDYMFSELKVLEPAEFIALYR